MGADRRSTIQRLALRIHVCTQAATDVGCHRIVIAARPSTPPSAAAQQIQRTLTPGVVASTGRCDPLRVAGRTDGHPKSQRGGRMALGPLDGHPTNQTNKRRGFMALQHGAMRHVHNRVLASWIVLMHVLLCRLHM